MVYNKQVIYFAAPLFNDAEKAFNLKLTIKLESLGFDVFLPQRDGVENNKSPYKEMSPAKRRKAMFELDRKVISNAEIFLFVLDGRVPDEGACVELGMAYMHKQLAASNKKLIGYHSDNRAAFVAAKLNPMVKIPLDYIASNESDLIKFLSNT